MSEKAWMLTVCQDGDLGDLVTWVDEHPEDDDLRKEGIDENLRWRLSDWLTSLCNQASGYPWYVPVPLRLARMLEMLIEDYREAMEAGDEEFNTRLSYSEG